MPYTDIRFIGDYNEDGTPKYPNAEYTGISKESKDYIREGIRNGKITPKPNGQWTQVYETWYWHPWVEKTQQLGSYGIRNNNGSNIIDIIDTYNFDRWYQQGVPDRNQGYQIEVRDTLHLPNANPKLYKPYKREER